VLHGSRHPRAGAHLPANARLPSTDPFCVVEAGFGTSRLGLAGSRGEDPYAEGAYVTGDPVVGIRDYNPFPTKNPLNYSVGRVPHHHVGQLDVLHVDHGRRVVALQDQRVVQVSQLRRQGTATDELPATGLSANVPRVVVPPKGGCETAYRGALVVSSDDDSGSSCRNQDP